jgi:hypothetical protein
MYMAIGLAHPPVTEEDQKKIAALVSPPLTHRVVWRGNVLLTQTDEWFHTAIRIAYNPEISSALKGKRITDENRYDLIVDAGFDDEAEDEEVAKYRADIARWLDKTNQTRPIVFAFSSETIEVTELEVWNSERRFQIEAIPTRVLPLLLQSFESAKSEGSRTWICNLSNDVLAIYLNTISPVGPETATLIRAFCASFRSLKRCDGRFREILDELEKRLE